MSKLSAFKFREGAELPEFATAGSAAFDLKAYLKPGDRIRAYSPANREMFFPVKPINGRTALQIMPSFRVLVPTGIKLDIPAKHWVSLHIRSSMALKFGIQLANNTGIIDSDYVDELFIMLTNISDTPIHIFDGDRVAQGILHSSVGSASIVEATEDLVQKTDREGGFGSTGVAELPEKKLRGWDAVRAKKKAEAERLAAEQNQDVAS